MRLLKATLLSSILVCAILGHPLPYTGDGYACAEKQWLVRRGGTKNVVYEEAIKGFDSVMSKLSRSTSTLRTSPKSAVHFRPKTLVIHSIPAAESSYASNTLGPHPRASAGARAGPRRTPSYPTFVSSSLKVPENTRTGAAQTTTTTTTTTKSAKATTKKKSVSGRLAKGTEEYPFLSFGLIGAVLTAADASLITANLKAHERDVVKAKQKLGLPIVDLSSERSEAEKVSKCA